MKYITFFLFITSTILIASCSSTPPNNQGNICKFAQHPSWFNDAKKSEKMGTLISILMAFVKQESISQNARPPIDGLPLYL